MDSCHRGTHTANETTGSHGIFGRGIVHAYDFQRELTPPGPEPAQVQRGEEHAFYTEASYVSRIITGTTVRTDGVDIPELGLAVEDEVAQLVADLTHLHAPKGGRGGTQAPTNERGVIQHTRAENKDVRVKGGAEMTPNSRCCETRHVCCPLHTKVPRR